MRSIILICLLLLSSCSAVHFYSGPHKEESELAFLRQNMSEILIISIDYKRVQSSLQQDYYLLPGRHLIQASLNFDTGFGHRRSHAPKSTCFFAKAGKRYLVRSELLKNDWILFVEEFDSDKRLFCH